jgi:16S rRNA (cytosine(1402)-N(4))-methyltransferase
MLSEVIGLLGPRDGGRYLDATFGGGGYAGAILEAASCTLWAIDRDPDAIARGASLAARFPGRLHLIQGRFGDMLALLAERDVTALDGVVLDLGVSSFQLDEPARGFSFRADGPLDMRMSRSGLTAAELVNTLAERELADVLFEFGEERASRRIARALVAAGCGDSQSTATGPLWHRSGDTQLPGAAHPGERRAGRDRGGAGSGEPATGAWRQADRGGIPFARGPYREAVHDTGDGAHAVAIAA